MSDSSDPSWSEDWLEGLDSGWLGSADAEKWEDEMLKRLETPVEPGEVEEQGW